MHRATDGFGQLRVGHCMWSHRVDRSARFRFVQAEQDQTHDIIGVNPGNDVRPIADGTTGKHLERHDHFLERPAAFAEHDADAQHDRSNTKGFGRLRRGFPSLHDIGEKPLPS